MIRKVGAVLAFAAGIYFGHQYALGVLETNPEDLGDYWGGTGRQLVTIGIPLGAGLVAAFVAYLALNLFARAD